MRTSAAASRSQRQIHIAGVSTAVELAAINMFRGRPDLCDLGTIGTYDLHQIDIEPSLRAENRRSTKVGELSPHNHVQAIRNFIEIELRRISEQTRRKSNESLGQ